MLRKTTLFLILGLFCIFSMEFTSPLNRTIAIRDGRKLKLYSIKKNRIFETRLFRLDVMDDDDTNDPHPALASNGVGIYFTGMKDKNNDIFLIQIEC